MQQSCHPPCEGRPRGPALLAILDPIDPIDLKNYKILISRWEAWYYFKIRPVESEVQSSFSCTLNPHFFRRVFCMLRYTQLYSNPCISCIFWLHHACRSTAAHASGSGRAAPRLGHLRREQLAFAQLSRIIHRIRGQARGTVPRTSP